uniref:C-type lectin domain-containing protein n=1 Tax=Scleropages formosus TaxID=113540 RepID=A0A8C9R9M1_SCLFO
MSSSANGVTTDGMSSSANGVTTDGMNSSTNPLLLVQENKTWNEALRYCRDNNMELVSVHNADVQKWVEETVKNATSGHVWLGLRYTCVLNFWFWVSAQSIQYEHWAPSNETGAIDCGTTGAVKSSEGYKWVPLLDTEKLN